MLYSTVRVEKLLTFGWDTPGTAAPAAWPGFAWRGGSTMHSGQPIIGSRVVLAMTALQFLQASRVRRQPQQRAEASLPIRIHSFSSSWITKATQGRAQLHRPHVKLRASNPVGGVSPKVLRSPPQSSNSIHSWLTAALHRI